MQKKIIIAILLTVVIISSSLGLISYIAVRESIDHTLEHRLELSRAVARNIDLVLSNSLKRLYDISISGTIDLSDGDWGSEGRALKKAFDYSIFSDGLFITDTSGNVVFNYPQQPVNHATLLTLPSVSRVISEGRPFISDIYTVELTKQKLIYILVPLKNKNGVIEGAVGAEIDPSSQTFNEIIRSFREESSVFMEVVDSHGVVIASSDPKRMFKDQLGGHSNFLEKLISDKKAVITKCHRCHEAAKDDAARLKSRSVDIMAYAPLELAAWGVSIVQPEKDILSPITNMKRSFLLVSLVCISISIMIGVAMSRRIVKPVHELTDAALKIAHGDMSKAVAFGGADEIGTLSTSFEVMRLKLADSMEELKNYNAELEEKVVERTGLINNSRKKIKELLQKVITSQEEERKRIAREFHDSIIQDLAAALIKVDLCRNYPGNVTPEKIDGIKYIIEKSMDDLYRIINNLRPTILDDLGFEASIQWLIDNHLESKNIRCYISKRNISNELNFDPQAEIQLFRIIQEAIINISRHAMAENVSIFLEIRKDNLHIEIEDDGCGFDPEAVASGRDSLRREFGLLGMKERASFLNWQFNICSTSETGTTISLRVPVGENRFSHGV
ncbi:MAG: HAMP domain-containing protein [Nitrospirae bacterium]|nr:HAMP domain-containing protein [Nitrospirota bacterium]